MNSPTGEAIAFTVPAVPVAQPRQRHAMIAGHVRNYTPKNDPVNTFKAAAQMALRQAYQGPPLTGPIRLDVVYVFPRPKSMIWKSKPMPRERHTKKPDRDNVEKALKDSLSKLAWVDDSQVWCGEPQKWIAAGGEQPHVEVVIRQVASHG